MFGKPGVRGPQVGERLRDVKDFITYVVAADWQLATAESTIPKAFGEDS